VALLTGGRVKIGYQAGIKLLRAGARLIVTTRFPATRRRATPCAGLSADWGNRLEIYGLDSGIRRASRPSATSSSAAATGSTSSSTTPADRAPPAEFYEHMMGASGRPLHGMPEPARSCSAAGIHPRGLRAPPAEHRRAVHPPSCRSAALEEERDRGDLFPQDGSTRTCSRWTCERNSWRMLMADVPSVDCSRDAAGHAVAPFILNARLKPLMPDAGAEKHIVNVSGSRASLPEFKTTRHPHTNMAKGRST